MNYDKLRKDLTTLGFTHKYINLITEAVSIDTELRKSIEEVQGTVTLREDAQINEEDDEEWKRI